MHDQLCMKVADKLVPYVANMLEEAVRRGEITISDTHAMAVFLVYGQAGILMDGEIKPEDKMRKAKQCLFELL